MSVWPTPQSPVLLLAGASGTGKSAVSYPLARRLGVALLELDDIVEALQAMTTPRQLPELHYWATHPEAAELPAERIVELQIALAEALLPAVHAVVANHLETRAPVLIEGDYLLPGPLPAGARMVLLDEPDEAAARQLPAARAVRRPATHPGPGQLRLRPLARRPGPTAQHSPGTSEALVHRRRPDPPP